MVRELHRLKLHEMIFGDGEIIFVEFNNGSRKLHGRINHHAVDPNLTSDRENGFLVSSVHSLGTITVQVS